MRFLKKVKFLEAKEKRYSVTCKELVANALSGKVRDGTYLEKPR